MIFPHTQYDCKNITHRMNLDQWSKVAQIITVPTGFLTLIFVAWYTILTKKLRDDAKKQNEILSEQLKDSRNELQRRFNAEIESSHPTLNCGNGIVNNTRFYANSVAVMAQPIRDLEIFSKDFSGTIYPNDYVAVGTHTNVELALPLPESKGECPFEFEVRYTTSIGVRAATKYRMRIGENAVPRKIGHVLLES